MNRTIFLDTGPLGILTNPKRPADTVDALRWAASHLRAGNRLLVPSVADYEVRRELVRLGRTSGIASLDAWNALPSGRYVPLMDSALRLASNLWAQARNAGTPTADPKELDCDVLIAAQALDYQSVHGLTSAEIVMATVNVGHLSQFLPADLWQNITP
jgi:predicted nucleic acid-binding protein